MKYLIRCLALILLVVSIKAHAQPKINGVLGIEFGISQSKFKSEINVKKPKEVIDNKKGMIGVRSITFGKFKEADLFATFVNDKFVEGIVEIVPESDSQLAKLYEEVIQELEDKYGKGERSFTTPISTSGKSWSELAKDINDKNGYRIDWPKIKEIDFYTILDEDAYIRIIYRHSKMSKSEQQKLDTKNLKDY